MFAHPAHWFTLWFCRAFDSLWVKEGAAPLCVQDLQTKCGGRIPRGSEYCAVWGRRDLGAYTEDSWEQWAPRAARSIRKERYWREKGWGIKEEAFSSLAIVFKSKARDNPQKCDFLHTIFRSFPKASSMPLGYQNLKSLDLCIFRSRGHPFWDWSYFKIDLLFIMLIVNQFSGLKFMSCKVDASTPHHPSRSSPWGNQKLSISCDFCQRYFMHM